MSISEQNFLGEFENGPPRQASSRLPPSSTHEQQHLRADSSTGIEYYVLPASRAGGQIALMPFVETGDEQGSKHRDPRPAQRPVRISALGQRVPPGAKQKNAEHGVSDNMPALANVVMPYLEPGVIDSEQEMQQRIEEAAGVMRGKIGRRLDHNDD